MASMDDVVTAAVLQVAEAEVALRKARAAEKAARLALARSRASGAK